MIKKNLISNYLGQGWAALMGVAFVPSYINYLGIDGYGLIGIFAVMQIWFGLLDMGMAATLNREIARFTAGINSPQYVGNLLRSMEILAVAIAIVIEVIISFCSEWMAIHWLNSNSLSNEVISNSISVIGLVIGLRIIEGLYRSVLVGLQRQVLYNAIQIILSTFRWAGALAALVFIDRSITIFFYWQLAVSIISLLTIAISAYIILPHTARTGSFSKDILWRIKGFVGGFLGFSFLSMALSNIDKVLLIKLLNLHDYGYYILATTVAGALNVLTGPVVQAYFPRLSELHALESKKEFAKIYHQGAKLVTVFYGTAAILVITMAEVIIRIWSQNVELSTRVAPLLSVVAVGNLLNCLMWMPFQAQLAVGWTSLMIRSNVIALLLFMPLILWVVPRYGAIGAAWVWVILNAGYVFFIIYYMHRKILIEEKWRWYIQDIAIPLLTCSAVVIALNELIDFDFSRHTAAILQLALISLLAFVASVFATQSLRVKVIMTLLQMKLFKY
jgi:O-antigen/teichoic acid export membrane protein